MKKILHYIQFVHFDQACKKVKNYNKQNNNFL